MCRIDNAKVSRKTARRNKNSENMMRYMRHRRSKSDNRPDRCDFLTQKGIWGDCYLTETYRDNDLSVEERIHSHLIGNMAYDGDWKPFFEYITETLKRFAAQRDLQKGEAFVHGFTLSQTCMTNLYLPVSELDAGVRDLSGRGSGGYADIYLQPMLGIYPDIEHSYVLELKYLPSKATDAELTSARETAIGQITRYAESVNVERTAGHTQVHRLVLIWRGMDLAVAEELD